MQESEIKYLAGLYDADGSASFIVNSNGRVYLKLQVAASDAVSPDHKILHWLSDTFGGNVYTHAVLANSVVKVWILQKRADLEKLVPRLVKHLVIKGSSLAYMWKVFKVYGGKRLEEYQIAHVREQATLSRLLNGPVKPKNHPTWAWVAGYIDGDGCLKNRYYANQKAHHMRVSATAHEKDLYGLRLLQKAFGGSIRKQYPDKAIYIWSRNLGYSDSSFATRFLRRLVGHLRIKKHKAEMILANHSQRLSVSGPKGQAIVQ